MKQFTAVCIQVLDQNKVIVNNWNVTVSEFLENLKRCGIIDWVYWSGPFLCVNGNFL